jgi:hypothetical protein
MDKNKIRYHKLIIEAMLNDLTVEQQGIRGDWIKFDDRSVTMFESTPYRINHNGWKSYETMEDFREDYSKGDKLYFCEIFHFDSLFAKEYEYDGKDNLDLHKYIFKKAEQEKPVEDQPSLAVKSDIPANSRLMVNAQTGEQVWVSNELVNDQPEETAEAEEGEIYISDGRNINEAIFCGSPQEWLDSEYKWTATSLHKNNERANDNAFEFDYKELGLYVPFEIIDRQTLLQLDYEFFKQHKIVALRKCDAGRITLLQEAE